jgi:hypothetical protein
MLKKNMERKSDKIGLEYKLLVKDSERIIQELIIGKQGLITETNVISDNKEKININIKYDRYTAVSGFNLPQEIRLELNSPDQKLEVRIETGNFVINEKINAQNAIPPTYEEAVIDY